jgi:hypothetical protein
MCGNMFETKETTIRSLTVFNHPMRNRSLLILIVVILAWQGCTYDLLPLPVNCELEGVVIDDVVVNDTDCGVAIGSIEVVASGGTTGNYQYRLDDGPLQSTAVFSNIGVGSYVVTVIDKSCSASEKVVIRNKNGVNIQIVATQNSGCTTSNGSVSIDGTGGTLPYTFKIDNGSYQGNKVFTGLKQGEYNLHVKDGAGCEAWEKVTVTSGITFSNHISSIIATKCAIDGGCHNGTPGLPDFREFRNVKANAAMMKELTGERIMPKQGSLTQEQIDQIACWVDDGAIQN